MKAMSIIMERVEGCADIDQIRDGVVDNDGDLDGYWRMLAAVVTVMMLTQLFFQML